MLGGVLKALSSLSIIAMQQLQLRLCAGFCSLQDKGKSSHNNYALEAIV